MSFVFLNCTTDGLNDWMNINESRTLGQEMLTDVCKWKPYLGQEILTDVCKWEPYLGNKGYNR